MCGDMMMKCYLPRLGSFECGYERVEELLVELFLDDFLLSTQKSARKSRGRKGEKKNKDVSQARVKRHKETKIWICFFTRKNTYLEICTKLTTGSQSNCKEHDVETGGLYAPERIDLHALTRRVTNSWMWISEHWRHQATTPHVNNRTQNNRRRDVLDDLAKLVRHHFVRPLRDRRNRHQPRMSRAPVVPRQHSGYMLEGGRQDSLATQGAR